MRKNATIGSSSRRPHLAAALALLLTLASTPWPAAAQVPPTRSHVLVVSVVDGDTLQILSQSGLSETLQLSGVYAPVIGECYGAEAADQTARLALNRLAGLELDARERDAAGRLLGYLWLDETTTLNEQLLRGGAARYLPSVLNGPHDALLRAAEQTARTNRSGGWSACQWVSTWPPSPFSLDVFEGPAR